MKAVPAFFKSLFSHIKDNKPAFAVYLILNGLVIGVMIRMIFYRNFESLFTCFLALVLFLIPPLLEKTFSLRLPTALEIVAYVFVFAAEILGEIGNFYARVPIWDTVLHTVNGFIFAAFGFCLVEMLNRGNRERFHLSPVFCALVAFCLSMTVGVLWEFFEYLIDSTLNMNMQKDVIVDAVYTDYFSGTGSQAVMAIERISETTVHTASGEAYKVVGYLDIGLIDTMGDLFVNFIGAAVFSVIGYFHVRHEGKSRFAKQFIPVVLPREEKKGQGGETEALSEQDARVRK